MPKGAGDPNTNVATSFLFFLPVVSRFGGAGAEAELITHGLTEDEEKMETQRPGHGVRRGDWVEGECLGMLGVDQTRSQTKSDAGQGWLKGKNGQTTHIESLFLHICWMGFDLQGETCKGDQLSHGDRRSRWAGLQKKAHPNLLGC